MIGREFEVEMVYSPEEMSYIEENLGKRSLKAIANTLGRTTKSLEITLIRKKGSSNTKEHTGMITAGELAKILRIDRNTVIGWTGRHGLPSRKKITRFKRKFTFIGIDAFWEWASRNRDRIDFANVHLNTLPPEPNWVELERIKKKKIDKNYKYWTVLEEEYLMQLISSGLSIQKAARYLDRTPGSVEKKYYRLMNTLKSNLLTEANTK